MTLQFLTPSIVNSLPVVVFRNTARNVTDAFVCDSPEVAREEAERLRRMPHIKLLAITDAAVKR